MGRKDLEVKAKAVLERLDRDDEDPREAYLVLNATIDDYRRSGDPVPEILVSAKRHLEWELAVQSQGR